ncbi:hypothetical protein [Brucella intermedia]|uniref:hypothetical protein n=1 Tax=Brucella intermedia TaxID=94625 RepID=UPI0023602270|nr:hypothetical protein [Brucella intermedia]
MAEFSPSPEEKEGIIGYPEEGLYVLAMKGENILGGERCDDDINDDVAMGVQGSALMRYYPADAELVAARCDSAGVFTRREV